jgi:hypothetical protein
MDMQPISISLHDESGGYEISPERVPLAVLRSFSRDVDELLRGESSDVDTATLDVAVLKGSFALQTVALTDPGFLRDLQRLAVTEMLDGVDARRREVIERWQKLAKGARKTVFSITAPFLAKPVVINMETDYRSDDADQWVRVERYIQGEVVDIGGMRKPNAHIKLPDGTLLMVESEREVFRDDKINRLYKIAMVRITAEYNVVTRKYRSARLIGFEEHQQSLDENALERLTQRGAKAWKDVPAASAWVDALRGSDG